MYSLKHVSYCGMVGIPECFETRAEVRGAAARRLARYRKRFPVTTLESGLEWEIQEPADCSMVPDACGVLRITHTTFECRECGCEHETRSDARECCTNIYCEEGE